MKPDDERRAEELGHLKVALATFALQLDAFELRTHEAFQAVQKLAAENPLTDGGPRVPGVRRTRKDGLPGGQ
jgi:hypothetical protein